MGEILSKKSNQIKFFSLGLLLLILIFFVNALTDESKFSLAELVNGQATDTPEIQDYLVLHNNFADLDFKVVDDTPNSDLIKTKIEGEMIRGYEINNKNYAVHLIICKKEEKGCVFRVNGISTKIMSSPDISDDLPYTFNLDGDYELKVNSITFDYCNDARFCDLEHDAYDLVDISIEGVK